MFAAFEESSHPQIHLQRVETSTPTLVEILTHDSFHVTVEGTKVGSATTVLDALMLVFASYYVFNLKYPEKLKATMTFIQKGVCEMHTHALSINKVVDLITKVNVML